jgi:CubicO group peptidase (beta-lactamase class C family)
MRQTILVLLVLLAAPATAQPEFPDTRAGKVFEAWLTSFNSADARQIEAFNKAYERNSQVANVLKWREETGGFEFLRLEASEPARLVALVKEKQTDTAGHLELTLIGDGKGDNLIMDLRTILLPDEFAPPRLSLDAALHALAKHAEELAQADRFSGALLVARNGKVLFERAYGKADRKSGQQNSVETLFRMGSMNKMFTAVAVLQLVEGGKLSLDKPVEAYLPDYPNREVAAKVTVRHLLNHTGGTGDIFGPDFDRRRLSLKEHSDYLALYGARGPEHEPGKEDRYSNYGYVLLGALIEKVSGVSYYDYVRQNIYRRAGMRSTDSLPESQSVPGRAAGYTKQSGSWISNADTLPYRGMAAGGGYSSVQDLFKFAQALQAGQLISKQSLAEATRPQDLGKSMGYGFALREGGRRASYGAAGGAPGMNGELRVYPQLGYVLIGLSNLDPPAATRLVEYFAARMPVE